MTQTLISERTEPLITMLFFRPGWMYLSIYHQKRQLIGLCGWHIYSRDPFTYCAPAALHFLVTMCFSSLHTDSSFCLLVPWNKESEVLRQCYNLQLNVCVLDRQTSHLRTKVFKLPENPQLQGLEVKIPQVRSFSKHQQSLTMAISFCFSYNSSSSWFLKYLMYTRQYTLFHHYPIPILYFVPGFPAPRTTSDDIFTVIWVRSDSVSKLHI